MPTPDPFHPSRGLRLLIAVVLMGGALIGPSWAQSVAAPPAQPAKFLGNIVARALPGDFDRYWDQVTPENAGKWGSVAATPQTDGWQWSTLDQAYRYALDHRFPFKEHNLIWGQQQPPWMESLDPAQQRQAVAKWIRLGGARYPQTALVDVVNEPLHHPPRYREALGGKGATGWDWVIWAFQQARQAFPRAQLLLNDYNVLKDARTAQRYRQLIDLLQARGLIDGIGCEAHFLENVPGAKIRSNLKLLAATGLPIYISEYDVNAADDATQLKIYQEQFPIFWTDPAVHGITLWGYRQGHIWRKNAYLIGADGRERPAFTWLRHYIATQARP